MVQVSNRQKLVIEVQFKLLKYIYNTTKIDYSNYNFTSLLKELGSRFIRTILTVEQCSCRK